MSETIGEFLVTLGYKIDKQSESKFTDAIAGATRLVVAMGAAFVAASSTVALGVVSISRDLDQIYFQSQRTGASAANIKAFAYAMTQLGISESEASQNLEGFAHAQRMMGGSFTSVMSELNIATKDAKGNSRDTIEIMADFGKSLSGLNQAAAIAYGTQFGLTENFVISSKKGGEQFTKDFRDLYAKHKVDLNQGAKDSNAFWTQMRSLGATLGVLGAAIETNLIEMFGRSAKSLSELVEKNMPAIAATLTKFCEGLIEIGVALAPVVWGIIELTPKVISFFKEVDKGLRSLIGDNGWATGLELTAVSLVLLAGPTGLLFKLLGFLTRIVAITLPGWLLGALGISAAGVPTAAIIGGGVIAGGFLRDSMVDSAQPGNRQYDQSTVDFYRKLGRHKEADEIESAIKSGNVMKADPNLDKRSFWQKISPTWAGGKAAENIPVKGGANGQAFAGGGTENGTLTAAKMLYGQNNELGISQFNGFNDAHHKAGKHKQGLASDLSLKDSSSENYADKAQKIRDHFKSVGLESNEFTVIDEKNNPSRGSTGPHIHYQFNSQESAEKYQKLIDSSKKAPSVPEMSGAEKFAGNPFMKSLPNYKTGALAGSMAGTALAPSIGSVSNSQGDVTANHTTTVNVIGSSGADISMTGFSKMNAGSNLIDSLKGASQ